MKKFFILCLLALLLTGAAFAEEIQYDKWNDFVYAYDGGELQCSVYIPAAYAEDNCLPLITYIPDSSLVGKAMNTYKRAACPVNWIKDDKMERAPALMLLIRFTDADSDVNHPMSEAAQIVPIIDFAVKQYGLDENRLYLTGQSMGGIMDFSVNDAYPDKFAATLYVGCQMGGEVGDEQYQRILESAAFADQTFAYIVSRKDGKAPYGQDDVEKALEERGIVFGKNYELEPSSETLEADVQAVLDLGHVQNLLAFTQVTPTGDPAAEHMQSFKYAYAVDALYDWLLSQHK